MFTSEAAQNREYSISGYQLGLLLGLIEGPFAIFDVPQGTDMDGEKVFSLEFAPGRTEESIGGSVNGEYVVYQTGRGEKDRRITELQDALQAVEKERDYFAEIAAKQSTK